MCDGVDGDGAGSRGRAERSRSGCCPGEGEWRAAVLGRRTSSGIQEEEGWRMLRAKQDDERGCSTLHIGKDSWFGERWRTKVSRAQGHRYKVGVTGWQSAPTMYGLARRTGPLAQPIGQLPASSGQSSAQLPRTLIAGRGSTAPPWSLVTWSRSVACPRHPARTLSKPPR